MLIFSILAFFNPSLYPFFDKFLNKHFFSKRRMNKDYIEPKYLSDNWIWKYKYSEIESVEGKGKYEKK